LEKTSAQRIPVLVQVQFAQIETTHARLSEGCCLLGPQRAADVVFLSLTRSLLSAPLTMCTCDTVLSTIVYTVFIRVRSQQADASATAPVTHHLVFPALSHAARFSRNLGDQHAERRPLLQVRAHETCD
jgi:hypothetical protein